MGRAPRAEFRGALYHVFSRGNRRERIFLDDDDYRSYLESLQGLAKEMDAAVIAYCLMPNHPHLCIQTHGAPLSKLMQRLNGRHSKRFNRKYQLRGHLNEGRYNAIVVDADTYLLRLVRYIHRNPVRAGLVGAAGEWSYSSHSEYLAPSSWVARQKVLAHFADFAAFEAYVALDTNAEDAEVFSEAGRGFRFAGEANSIERVAAAIREESPKDAACWQPLGRRRMPPGAEIEAVREDAAKWLSAHGPFDLDEVQGPALYKPLRNTRRALVGFLHGKRYSQAAIGTVVGRDEPAISRLIARLSRERTGA
jgi:REP element-mobilizing transposase RayT